MKKFNMLFALSVILLVACNTQPESLPVDLAAEKAAVSAVVARFEATTNTDTLAAFMTADAMVTGTAPTELWTRQQMIDMWKEYFSSVVPEHNYLGDPVVIVAADGKSATAIEEYIMPVMSPVIPARNTLHLVKTGDKWMIDFIGISFIPKNEDIPKIDEVLSQQAL